MDAPMQALLAAMAGERRRHAAAARFYEALSTGQSPGALVICCSDSRAAPEHITRADPGILFVKRTVAGLVPPPPQALERAWLRGYGVVTRLLGLNQLAGAWYATWAAIEYPVMHLQVPNILVLGHSNCGGIALACCRRGEHRHLPDTDCWVDMVRPVVRRIAATQPNSNGNAAAERAAILWSRDNLLRHRGIADRVQRGLTAIHAAHYDIASGTVSLFDAERRAFLPLGEDIVVHS